MNNQLLHVRYLLPQTPPSPLDDLYPQGHPLKPDQRGHNTDDKFKMKGMGYTPCWQRMMSCELVFSDNYMQKNQIV